MKLRFLGTAQIALVDAIVNDQPYFRTVTFKAGQVVDANVFAETADTFDLQFPDGSLGLDLPKDLFEVVVAEPVCELAAA